MAEEIKPSAIPVIHEWLHKPDGAYQLKTFIATVSHTMEVNPIQLAQRSKEDWQMITLQAAIMRMYPNKDAKLKPLFDELQRGFQMLLDNSTLKPIDRLTMRTMMKTVLQQIIMVMCEVPEIHQRYFYTGQDGVKTETATFEVNEPQGIEALDPTLAIPAELMKGESSSYAALKQEPKV